MLSRIINKFLCKYVFIAFTASMIYDTSGSFTLLKGVGTQIDIASSFAMILVSFVACNLFLLTKSRKSESSISDM